MFSYDIYNCNSIIILIIILCQFHQKEESYKEWLKGQQVCVEIDAQEQEELKPLRDFWTDPKLDANETFLRDYILNNKYMDKESTITDLDYDQIAHDSDENLSEDEKNIKKQEEFEHKYNFRFEEPDREFIKRYYTQSYFISTK